MIAIVLDPDDSVVKPLLIDTAFLKAVNSVTVGQAILTTIVEYGINYNSVRLIMSDNARYMTKCVREILMPNLLGAHY